MKDMNQLRDTVYNCHPSASGDRAYARGMIIGCVSGLMATGYTFEDSIRQLKEATLTSNNDLKEEHVVGVLPASWVSVWRKAE